MPKSDPETLAYHRAWRMQNPEKVRAAKEKHKKTAKFRETLSAYRASRKEAHRIEVAEWRAKNPDKEAGYYQKRRNKMKTTMSTTTHAEIIAKPDTAWREVSKDEFFRVIGRQDVHPSIQPGKYPYTAIWQTPQRQSRGKSVGRIEGGRELTAWYLPSNTL